MSAMPTSLNNHLPPRQTPLSEGACAHAPSWNTRLDGRPTQILRCNLYGEGPKGRPTPSALMAPTATSYVLPRRHGHAELQEDNKTKRMSMQHAYPRPFGWLQCCAIALGHALHVLQRCHQRTVYQHKSPSSVEDPPLKATCNGQSFAMGAHLPDDNCSIARTPKGILLDH